MCNTFGSTNTKFVCDFPCGQAGRYHGTRHCDEAGAPNGIDGENSLLADFLASDFCDLTCKIERGGVCYEGRADNDVHPFGGNGPNDDLC